MGTLSLSQAKTAQEGRRLPRGISIGIPKITTEGPGISFRIPGYVDCVGRPWTLIDAKALILLDCRHKKRRPWTSLDVEPG